MSATRHNDIERITKLAEEGDLEAILRLFRHASHANDLDGVIKARTLYSIATESTLREMDMRFGELRDGDDPHAYLTDLIFLGPEDGPAKFRIELDKEPEKIHIKHGHVMTGIGVQFFLSSIDEDAQADLSRVYHDSQMEIIMDDCVVVRKHGIPAPSIMEGSSIFMMDLRPSPMNGGTRIALVLNVINPLTSGGPLRIRSHVRPVWSHHSPPSSFPWVR